jgi:hypothetical protein
MIDTDEDDGNKFYSEFSRHLTQIDELANVILRGHLLVESDLDAVMRATFFYPDFIKGRVSFERKGQIARAMALRTQNEVIWDTLTALNELRNEVAHKREAKTRKAKMDQLRQTCLKQIKPERAAEHKNDTDREIVIMSCALCGGYLAMLADQLWGMRDYLNQVDEQLFPGEGGVPLRPPEES